MDTASLPALAGLFALVVLVSWSPLARVPVGAITALAILAAGLMVEAAVVTAACAVTTARILIAVAARRAGNGMSPSDQRAAVQAWLAGNRTYGASTFLAAAVPFLPGRMLFAILGSLRFPLRYAIAGCITGQLPLIFVSSWIMLALARWLTASDAEAAQVLGLYAVIVVVIRMVTSVDRDEWRTSRKIRFRSDIDERRMQMWTASMQSAPRPNMHPHSHAEDVIDVEAEEIHEPAPSEDERVLPPPPPPDPDQPAGSG